MIFEKIRKICEEKGISIAKLESECNLGNATVRGWKESMPRLNNLKKVANYLDVPIEQLLE